MEYQYHGIGFLAFVGLFFLAGFLGLYRAWLGIVAAAVVAAVTNYLLDDTALGLIAGTAGGLATGVGGAVIIPLLRAGRHGRPASNIRFVNHGAMGRTSLNFNWMKDDNIGDPGRRR
ncbi:hypothetical protein [Pseudodesulfovibrio methanolicus]|uniref:Uncharacterized protein n=1 Tax=Pseudodesulfovibrio methanolicus TaxID=3126690 RepID=A0ABZ2J008_9BACT